VAFLSFFPDQGDLKNPWYRRMVRAEKIRAWLPLLALSIASVAIFWSATGHDFLINWDDRQYVVENAAIKGLTFEHVRWAFTNFHVGNYAPLHLVSYMLDYEIWGLRPSGFIFTNILLHTLNGLLFYLLLRRGSGEKAWVFLASLIFLLHPVQVESVVWVSQRKNVLAMFFFLVSFHCYASYRQTDARHDGRFYALSLAAFTLALLSKSVAIVLPLALILYDVCDPEKRGIKRVLGDKIPFVLLAVVFGIAAIQSQSAQFQGGGRTSYHGGSPLATFLTMLPVMVRYLRLVIWPANLSAFYDLPIKTGVDTEIGMSALLLLLLAIAGVVLYMRRRDLFFWFALFFVGLMPVSQIVPIVTLMNDRYLYFPMLGASAILGFALMRDVEWAEILASRKHLLSAVFSLLVIGTCVVASVQRIGVWQNSYTLWDDTVKKSPNVALAHDAFGEALMERGAVDDAIRQFQVALRLEPDGTARDLSPVSRNAIANTYNNLGAAYGMKGMTDDAIPLFATAIRLHPDFGKAYFNLGNAFMHKGAVVQALQCFETAFRLNPDNPSFDANLRMTREILNAGNARKPVGKAE
jgi:hypothetical protein